MNHLRTCPICKKQFFGPECPNCGSQAPVEEREPVEPTAVKLSDIERVILKDPLSLFLWDLVRFVPSGKIMDSIVRMEEAMKRREPPEVRDPSLFHLALHCKAMSTRIRRNEEGQA